MTKPSFAARPASRRRSAVPPILPLLLAVGWVCRLDAQTVVACGAPNGNVPAPTVAAAPPDLIVSWKKVPRAIGYAVFRRNPDGTCWSLTPQGTTATSFREPIPATPGIYHYQVAVRTGGTTELSPWTPFDASTTPTATGGGAPAPSNLAVTGTPTTATVTWGAPKGAVNYRVNRALAGTTAWTSLTPSPITATSLANDVLPDPTQTYTYSVLAYQRNGQYGEAHLDFRAPPPTNPTGLVGSAAGSTVSLSWQPVRYAAGYLVSGPGITGTPRIATTSFSVSAVPDGANVYRVGAVFDPGAVQTPSSQWPAVTVQVQAQPILTCACTATGPFTTVELKPLTGSGSTTTFIHPSAGTFTVNAQALTSSYTPAQLDVLDSRGQSVLSEGMAAAWALSPDNRFFVVVNPPTSTNAGAPLGVYLVQSGPARWPRIIDAVAWPDGYWGFGGNAMFVMVRSQNPYGSSSSLVNLSFVAYNLYSASPGTAALQISETNVSPGRPYPLTFSPCGDRLMYLRFMGTAGQADFYRRTGFGAPQTPVIADYDPSLPGPLAASVSPGLAQNTFLVMLAALRERTTQQTNFPSTQCSP